MSIMVLEFHVIRCFSCQSFQVQQVKKANKWSCKLCGEKQSLLKEYGRGSGADCRRHVQKLNAMRGAMMEEQEGNTWSLWEQQVEAEEQKQGEDQVTQTQVSRWTKYLDTPKEAEEEEPEWNVLMDRHQLHGNNMTDRDYSVSKRKRMEKTDSQEDSCSPHQPTYPKRKPGRPSTTNSPPSQKVTSLPSVSSGMASRCARFLSTGCQVQVAKGLSGGGWSQCIGGATAMSCPDLAQPRPPLPVSSMFESGDDFSFDDDDFLTCQRV
ncbi:MRN complex-interacting protein [Acanthochromis polyacanthus]|uniref:MRN complex-interacting protein n=1 Tax=Acanthochromis polyacanthus TaxID=80966 RepID=UPI00223480BE|nr:MRN complex-interacting protein [Acanthochromis polyacanthus]